MNKKFIDVSKWNAIVNFSFIKSSVDGVIVRAGFRGNTNAVLNTDSRFFPYMEELNKFEVPLGAYFITSAITIDEAIEEANFFIDLIEQSGIKLSIPIFVCSDYTTTSHNGRADKLSTELRTRIVKTFIKQCKARNYNCGLYTKRSWIGDKLIESELEDVILWLEDDTVYYTDRLKIALLKYKSRTSIKGIAGTIDVSIGDIDNYRPYIKEEVIKEEVVEEAKEEIVEEEKVEEIKEDTVKKEEEKIMITKAECKLNKVVKLDEAHLYKTSVATTIEDILTGKYYIANEKIIRGRVRISKTKNGEVIGWINVQ